MESRHFSVSIDGESFELVANVREAGQDLIFFLHGLGCSKNSFHHFWNCADFEDYSVLAIDLVGFGQSTKSERFSYSMEDQARVCASILAEFSDKNLHVVAHSMGGAVALLIPEQILSYAKTFVNIEGNLIGADCGIVSRKIISVTPDMFKIEILPDFKDAFDSLGEGYAAMDSTTVDALYRSAKSLVAWSDSNKLLETFLALPCPKVYFYGDENVDHSTVASVEEVPKVKIQNSGHFPMNDNPKDFYNELFKFLTVFSAT